MSTDPGWVSRAGLRTPGSHKNSRAATLGSHTQKQHVGLCCAEALPENPAAAATLGMADRMPLGRPPTRHGDAVSPEWLGPTTLLQSVLVMYFVFLLWMEWEMWLREEAALGAKTGGLHDADDVDDF
jgi:hypothetical protein